MVISNTLFLPFKSIAVKAISSQNINLVQPVYFLPGKVFNTRD